MISPLEQLAACVAIAVVIVAVRAFTVRLWQLMRSLDGESAWAWWRRGGGLW